MKKEKRLEVRLSHLEKSIIENRAEKCGISASEYVRRSALDKKITPLFTDEELQLFRSIGEVATGLARLSNLLKKREDKLLREANIKMGKELRDILNKFQK